jgi:hypothetical protein
MTSFEEIPIAFIIFEFFGFNKDNEYCRYYYACDLRVLMFSFRYDIAAQTLKKFYTVM